MPVTLTQAMLGKFLAAWLFIAHRPGADVPDRADHGLPRQPGPGRRPRAATSAALLLAGAYVSVGMLTSAMTRNQVISFVLSLVICLLLLLAGWPPVTELLRAAGRRPGSWTPWRRSASCRTSSRSSAACSTSATSPTTPASWSSCSSRRTWCWRTASRRRTTTRQRSNSRDEDKRMNKIGSNAFWKVSGGVAGLLAAAGHPDRRQRHRRQACGSGRT